MRKYKTSWNDAPGWANYLTRDADGTEWWHELEPDAEMSAGEWDSGGLVDLAHQGGGPDIDWAYTLQKRPEVIR